MTITGDLLIGAAAVAADEKFHAHDPGADRTLEPAFSAATPAHVDAACALAEEAFVPFSRASGIDRAGLLESIGAEIAALGDVLLLRAQAETGLPRGRLENERARTINQLRMFADLLRAGDWIGARIDSAAPDRTPAPKPDLRQQMHALGPVAVFGASNFPFAFSVAGGDTAAALAAGCPVVCRGHPAHPGVSELVGRAIVSAVKKSGLPAGAFSLLNGPSYDLGAALVSDARIKAVAFTGSRSGGLALMRYAQARPEPIPVYAEMSAINPVLLLPNALEARADALAAAFAGSLTLGAGQFCTNPGLILAIGGPALDAFEKRAVAHLTQAAPGLMLTPRIYETYVAGVSSVAAHAAVRTALAGGAGPQPNTAKPALFVTRAADFLRYPELETEIFGAASLIVACADEAELRNVLTKSEGQLTISLHLDEGDHALARGLLPLIERKAGRIVVNGWPTGVEVAPAMVHGGPYPATSDARTTSVGTLAIARFLRPICYQDFPDALLPPALQNANPLAVRRLMDGGYQT